MKRNSSKYQTMVLGKNKGTDDEPVFRCDESQLPISNTMEPLGVTINDKWNFEKHIAKICRKVSKQITAFKKIQKLLPFETRRDLYKAFILPHFNYCSITWHYCNKKSADKLEMVYQFGWWIWLQLAEKRKCRWSDSRSAGRTRAAWRSRCVYQHQIYGANLWILHVELTLGNSEQFALLI